MKASSQTDAVEPKTSEARPAEPTRAQGTALAEQKSAAPQTKAVEPSTDTKTDVVQRRKSTAPTEAERRQPILEVAREQFAKLTFNEVVWIFTLGSIIGFLVETLYCFLADGRIQNRQGMVYGPFNQVYGFGAIVIMLSLLPFMKKTGLTQFLVGALVGGVFETVCSVVEEVLFGTRSWGYSDMPLAILGGRTNVPYMVIWGALTIMYLRMLHPLALGIITRIREPFLRIISVALAAFFVFNMTVSALAVIRWNARQVDNPADFAIERVLDEHFPDERMRAIYPNMELIHR